MKTSVLTALSTTIVLMTQAPAAESQKISGLPFNLDPIHLHLLTNHIPILVTFSGLIVLGLGMLWKNDVTRRAAMALLLVGAAGGVVTYWLGQQAYKPVRGLADELGQDWLDLHMERAENVIWLFWAFAIWTAGALVAVWRRTRFANLAAVIAGLLGAAALGVSGWIADAGGKVRHPEIRGSSKPAVEETSSESETDSHEH